MFRITTLAPRLAPLLPLSKGTRAFLRPWHEEAIAACVSALRRSGFSSRHVDVLVRALYLAREGGEVGADAVQSAWRVLRLHSQRFESEEDAAAAAEGRGKTLPAGARCAHFCYKMLCQHFFRFQLEISA